MYEQNTHKKFEFLVEKALQNSFRVSVLVLVFLLPAQIFSQTTIWLEDFLYTEGTIQGSGTPPKWTRDVSACTLVPPNDYFEVRSNQMEGRDLDGEAVWTSETIDISSYSDVSISTDVSMGGNMEASDYIRFYYKLDGGAETLFSVNGDISNDFSPLVASQLGLNGSNLVIVVRVKNNGQVEIHRFDNMWVYEPIAGDFCSVAIVINEVVNLAYSTNNATASGVNPGCGGITNPVDIWYAYTATSSGNATFNLCGSSYNTRLAIWDACGGNELKCNDDDDDCGTSSQLSYITMAVVSGVTYYIQVGGNNALKGSGDLTISVIPYPNNNVCANAIPINEVLDLSFTTVNATASGINPGCGGSNPIDIWYAYTATQTGSASIDLCGSDYDTRLAIYSLCGGTMLDCNDDECDLQSVIAIDVLSGTTYYLQIGGYNAITGNGDLTIGVVPQGTNDDCANATAINEVTDLVFTTTGATAGGDNPGCGGTNPVDIWYAYTATSTGIAAFDLCGSNYDTRLAIWDACSGNVLACNDDNDYCSTGSLQSYVPMAVVSGNTYYVQVSGYNTNTGNGDLTIAVSPYPTNDDCANAIAIGEVADLAYSTIASKASGVNPGCGGATDPKDIWYAYTATQTGSAQFDLCGSIYNTRLAIYDACGGSLLACNDDDNFCGTNSVQSVITLQVSGYNDIAGNGDLTIGVVPQGTNDDCANATAINEVTDLVFTTTGATAGGDNPGCGGTNPVDIWYAYTATSTGIAAFDLCGSNYDTRLAIWDACSGNVLACNDDNDYCSTGSIQSYVSTAVTSGNTYYVQVGGHNVLTGNGDLTISVIPYPANDDCTDAIAINEVTDLAFTTNGATSSGDNPGCGGTVPLLIFGMPIHLLHRE